LTKQRKQVRRRVQSQSTHLKKNSAFNWDLTPINKKNSAFNWDLTPINDPD
jgi:hypothetical protein